MAIGKYTPAQIVTVMGDCVRLADQDAARDRLEDLRREIILEHAIQTVFADVRGIATKVNADLGYCAGYMPTEYGNQVLALLDVEHPVFGKNLDVTADEALAAGMRLAEQLREVKLAAERRAKRAAKAAAGLDLPDVEDAVSSANAKEVLSKLRAMKAGGVVAAPITTSVHTPLGAEAPRTVVAANPMEKLLGKDKPVTPTVEEDDDDYGDEEDYMDMEDDDDLKPVPPPVVVTPTKPEDRARLLEANDEAGAF